MAERLFVMKCSDEDPEPWWVCWQEPADGVPYLGGELHVVASFATEEDAHAAIRLLPSLLQEREEMQKRIKELEEILRSGLLSYDLLTTDERGPIARNPVAVGVIHGYFLGWREKAAAALGERGKPDGD